MTYDIWHLTHDTWHMTSDTWQVTHDKWHMTCDSYMWHVTCDTWHTGGNENCLKISASWLTVLDIQSCEDISKTHDLINYLISTRGVWRTVPATPGLLVIYTFSFYFLVKLCHCLCLIVIISLTNKLHPSGKSDYPMDRPRDFFPNNPLSSPLFIPEFPNVTITPLCKAEKFSWLFTFLSQKSETISLTSQDNQHLESTFLAVDAKNNVLAYNHKTEKAEA